MIQIKTTQFRNLDKICDEHYISLKESILKKLPSLTKRKRTFIEKNLKEILTSKPDELIKVNNEYKSFCEAKGKGKIIHINKGISSIFNYNWFTKKGASYYCAYNLAAKLNVKTCPYCNRNYTITVADGKSRIARPDFDHFFPKNEYPLLALSFYNLVPSCLICNRTIKNQKSVKYGLYIHPYEEGFNDTLKINYFPTDVESSIGIKSNFEIHTIENPQQHQKAKKCKNNFELFKLKEIYTESHNEEIADIIRKYYISNGKYLEKLQETFPKIGSMDELYRLAFGNYFLEDDFEKRPLSKLTKDVVDQLVFDYPRLMK